MSEMIDVTAGGLNNEGKFPSFFTLAALTKSAQPLEAFGNNPMSVMLTINGVEVPFSATVQDIWDRCSARLDEEAKEKAIEMIAQSGLDDLREAVHEAERKVKAALDRLPEL